MGHRERDCLLARDRRVVRVVARRSGGAADDVESARAIARGGRRVVIGRGRVCAPERRIVTHPVGHISLAVVVVRRRVHAAGEGVHTVALALNGRIGLVVERCWLEAAVDRRRRAHGLVVRVGARDIIKVGRLGAAIDGKHARRICMGHARTVIVERSRVQAARAPRRLQLSASGSAHAGDVKGGVHIVVGRCRVGAARKAAAAAIHVVRDVCEIGRTGVHAASKDSHARAVVGCGLCIEVERETIRAAQVRALVNHVHIGGWVVAVGHRVHAAGHSVCAQRVRSGRRVEVERGRVEAASVLAGTVVDGRRHAIVLGCGVDTAKNEWGARAVVVRGRGIISSRA